MERREGREGGRRKKGGGREREGGGGKEGDRVEGNALPIGGECWGSFSNSV